ncbi:hypothetical protein J5N97_009324 [Dioscorea zingiberensis]|uniref:CCAAT/enhancer-binding protein zeta n=1 Tax=Dioscorea zingiberensis TaxID=325984 RepID=A0A9D5CXV7_9LILI|nr:hypothetical protein J5N97_009324 [Dioscorea zingiberensis]
MALQNESVDDDLEHFEDIIEGPQDSSADLPSDKRPENSGTCAASLDGETPPPSHVDVCYNSDGEGNLNDETQCHSISFANRGQAQESPPQCRPNKLVGINNFSCTCAPISGLLWLRLFLSGANIVYNGDPLNDLSLSAFLDKFMEKKPKANRRAEGKWHGGSQIAPARKLDMNHHLIGDEILQLAEEDVPPEDVVFHRFYMNKTNSSKRPKVKKKKASEDEDAEDLLADVDNESEEEEIDDMLGTARLPVDETEGYDYDDLDEVADEDDDLLGDGSDTEVLDTHTTEKHHKEHISDNDDDNDDNEDFDDILGVDSSDSDDGDRDSEVKKSKQVSGEKKRKREKKTRPSPFASAEEFEHLMADKEKKKKSSKSYTHKKNKKSE